MPTYLNSNTEEIALGGERIPKGGTLETEIYTYPLPSGVTLVSDAPYYNTVIVSVLQTSTATIAIPDTIGGQIVRGVRLKLQCISGTFTVTLNHASNTPSIKFAAGMTYERSYRDRVVKSINVTKDTNGTLIVLVERL